MPVGAILIARFRELTLRLVALAMVAIVIGHAVTPVIAPLERVKGSAFSAATADVSVLAAPVVATKLVAPRVAAPLIAILALPAMIAARDLAPRSATFEAANPRGPPDRALLTSIHPLGPPTR